MYHLFDGWYFGRIKSDGSVMITKRSSSNEDSEVVACVDIPAHMWASVIAAVSANPAEYQAAVDFHMKPIVHHVTTSAADRG